MIDPIPSLADVFPEDRYAPAPAVPWRDPAPAACLRPVSAEETARALGLAAAAGMTVVARGGGTKLSWGEPPRRADLLLDVSAMSAVVAHEPGDLTVTVGPGIAVSDLMGIVEGAGGRLPVDPPFAARATIGGVISSGSTGPVHVRMREVVLGMQVALADGSLVRSGGRVVKNVTGFDLHKLLVGSLGTLGVITEVTLRLHPGPVADGIVSARMERARAAEALASLRESAARPVWTLVEIGGGDPDRGEMSIHLCLEGEVETVEEHARAATEAMGSGEMLSEEAAARLRGHLREFAHDGPGAAPCRIGVPPSRLLGLIGEAADLAICGHVESGLAFARVPVRDESGGEAASRRIGRLREIARGLGGTLVIEGPPVDGAGVWGPDPPDAFLMERVKHELDPDGVLSPGRFVGGI